MKKVTYHQKKEGKEVYNEVHPWRNGKGSIKFNHKAWAQMKMFEGVTVQFLSDHLESFPEKYLTKETYRTPQAGDEKILQDRKARTNKYKSRVEIREIYRNWLKKFDSEHVFKMTQIIVPRRHGDHVKNILHGEVVTAFNILREYTYEAQIRADVLSKEAA